MKTVRLNVAGVGCQGWISKVRLAVGQPGGMGKVDVDWRVHQVTMEYDAAVATVEAIQQALEEIGYDSTVIE